jgi:hypothetical protein
MPILKIIKKQSYLATRETRETKKRKTRKTRR